MRIPGIESGNSSNTSEMEIRSEYILSFSDGDINHTGRYEVVDTDEDSIVLHPTEESVGEYRIEGKDNQVLEDDPKFRTNLPIRMGDGGCSTLIDGESRNIDVYGILPVPKDDMILLIYGYSADLGTVFRLHMKDAFASCVSSGSDISAKLSTGSGENLSVNFDIDNGLSVGTEGREFNTLSASMDFLEGYRLDSVYTTGWIDAKSEIEGIEFFASDE